MRKVVIFGSSTLLVLILAALVSAEMSEKAQLGRELFYDPSFGGTLDPVKVSGLSCANCHADFDEAAHPDGQIRSGHSIVCVPQQGDMFRRGAKSGGGFCYQHYLQKIPEDKVEPIAIPEEQAEALMAYFEYVSADSKGPEFKIAMLDKEAAKAAVEKILALKGDSQRGWKLYARTCGVCHPTAKRGGIGSQLVKKRPPANIEKRMRQIASKVRGGGFVMPFYAEDRLSDQDIADIVAFIGELSVRKK